MFPGDCARVYRLPVALKRRYLSLLERNYRMRDGTD